MKISRMQMDLFPAGLWGLGVFIVCLTQNVSACLSDTTPTLPVAVASAIMDEIYAPGHLYKIAAGQRKIPKDAEKAWEWFVRHRRGAAGVIPIDYRERALAQSRLQNRPLLGNAQANWTPIVPGGSGVQPSGRIIDLTIHPNNTTLYAASASGGVWKTTDTGLNWVNCTDAYLPSLGCGSIAMDPNNSEVLYAGLGEGMTGTGSVIEPLGTGIYKTTNGGQTWSLMAGTGAGTMQFIVDIRFIGADSNKMLVAATGGGGNAGAGLWKTIDGGATWSFLFKDGSNNDLHIPTWSVSVDPTNADKIVFTTREQDTNGIFCNIYYSTNGMASFQVATIPRNREYDVNIGTSYRIELTRCDQTPNTMYALVGSSRSKIYGLWKSTDGGVNWTDTTMTGVPATGDYQPGQMTYNNCIAVNPQNANQVLFGSNLRGYKSTDGSGNWTAFADWAAADSLPYVHADYHVIAFNKTTPTTIYIGCDGGFFISTDGGATWTERNNGIVCTQIYRVANHPSNANSLIYGCQDNDKYVRKPDGSWHHYPNAFGDCMPVQCYPNDAEGDAYLGMNYGGSSIKFTADGGQTWYALRYYQTNNNGIPDAEQGAWVAPMMLDPKHPDNIWVSLAHVYRRVYDAQFVQNWTQVLQLPASNPGGVAFYEYMDFSCADANRQMYVGYYRQDAAQNWMTGIYRADIGDGTGAVTGMVDVALPSRPGVTRNGYVGAMKCDPVSNDTIWIAFSDFYFQPSGDQPRIFKSINKGQTWTNVTGNFPQDLPVNAIFIDPQNTQTIILGTDVGCYRSDDGGASWYEYSNGLPHAVVTDFAYFGPQRKLRAGTYGRGLWETGLSGGTGQPQIRIVPTTINFP